MSEEFVTERFCDERHKGIDGVLVSINDNIKTIYGRLNWFYVMAIGTLASGLSSLIIGIILLMAK